MDRQECLFSFPLEIAFVDLDQLPGHLVANAVGLEIAGICNDKEGPANLWGNPDGGVPHGVAAAMGVHLAFAPGPIYYNPSGCVIPHRIHQFVEVDAIHGEPGTVPARQEQGDEFCPVFEGTMHPACGPEGFRVVPL